VLYKKSAVVQGKKSPLLRGVHVASLCSDNAADIGEANGRVVNDDLLRAVIVAKTLVVGVLASVRDDISVSAHAARHVHANRAVFAGKIHLLRRNLARGENREQRDEQTEKRNLGKLSFHFY
jgi:hypothetical protein